MPSLPTAAPVQLPDIEVIVPTAPPRELPESTPSAIAEANDVPAVPANAPEVVPEVAPEGVPEDMPEADPPTTPAATEAASTAAPTTQTPEVAPAPETLTCNLNCYLPEAVETVPLRGSVGEGTDVGVPDLSPEECVDLCRRTEGCEAVVRKESGAGKCFGKRRVRTSLAEGGCQTQPPYVTEFLNTAEAQPWGKCTLLGDPHITTFDRKMGGTYPPASPSFYMEPVEALDAGEYKVVSSDAVTIVGRFGYTKDYPSAASTLGLAVTGPILGGKTLAVAYVGPSAQTPAYKGWRVTYDGQEILSGFPSTFSSPAGDLEAALEEREPQDFAVRARSTIGTAPGLHPSYAFEIGVERTLQVYVLPGPDLANVVITMRRVPGQSGLCGNFNCNQEDDEVNIMGEFEASPSAFPPQLSSPAGWRIRTGPSPDEVMATCPDHVKQSAGCGDLAEAEKRSCIFDACMRAAR